MIRATNREYYFLRYMPNVIDNKSVSIAAIFIDSDDTKKDECCTVSFTDDWQAKVLQLDPNADVEMLEALLGEMQDRLSCEGTRSEMIRLMEDSFSNVLQLSQRRICPIVPGSSADKTVPLRFRQVTSVKVA
jgi:hypothetical protein